MLRFIFYAVIIYLVYLAIKWAFRFGKAYSGVSKNKKTSSLRDRLKNIEEAEFTEVKKDGSKTD
jgi:hypothetical protein